MPQLARPWILVLALAAIGVTAPATSLGQRVGLERVYRGFVLFVPIQAVADLRPGDRAAPRRKLPIPPKAWAEARRVLQRHEPVFVKIVGHYLGGSHPYLAARALVDRSGRPARYKAPVQTGGGFAPGATTFGGYLVQDRPELELTLDAKKMRTRRYEWMDRKIGVELVLSLFFAPEALKREVVGLFASAQPLDAGSVARAYFSAGTESSNSLALVADLLAQPDLVAQAAQATPKPLDALRFTVVARMIQAARERKGYSRDLLDLALRFETGPASSLVEHLAYGLVDGEWVKGHTALRALAMALARRGGGVYVDGTLHAILKSGLYR